MRTCKITTVKHSYILVYRLFMFGTKDFSCILLGINNIFKLHFLVLCFYNFFCFYRSYLSIFPLPISVSLFMLSEAQRKHLFFCSIFLSFCFFVCICLLDFLWLYLCIVVFSIPFLVDFCFQIVLHICVRWYFS